MTTLSQTMPSRAHLQSKVERIGRCFAPSPRSFRYVYSGAAKCAAAIPSCSRIHSRRFQPPTILGRYCGSPTQRKYVRVIRTFGDHKLPVLDHSGLEVGGEQATIIYYCSQGKWIQLAG